MKPLRIKHPRRAFSASRDDNGVPHIEAGSWSAALYGLGYMHAIDRPTQMLFSRAVARGRSAELISDKPELLETDRFFRKAGLYRHLDREVGALDDLNFGYLTAYCEGINDGIKQAGRSLPMWAVGFQPYPWNQQSVMLIGNLLNFGGLAVGQQQNERLLLELIQAGVGRDKLKELFEPLLDDADFMLLQQIKISSRLSDEALELIADLPRLAGSNAWAVAPHRSASGHALLASDPHLEVNRLPSIWYEAVLRWDDEYVMGATLPGCPLFAVARTPKLAWGVTYLKGDTSDYFIEDCRRGELGWQYRRGDEWRDFQLTEEIIARKGQEPELLPVYHNELGTLDGDPEKSGPGYYLLSAWTGQAAGSGGSVATWLKLPGCQSALQAMDLVRDCPQPTLCWVFADSEGHIGRQANGCFPERAAGHNGMLPVPAWDAANHWKGWMPTTLLPRLYDPPEGYVASANENINPPGGPELVTQPVPDYRRRRIGERLGELPAATVQDMQLLQYDVISMQARDLLQIFLPNLPDGPIKERLTAWDCGYGPESLEATLFSRLYRNVLLEIFGQEPRKQGGFGWRRMLYLCSRAGFSMMVVTCIDRLLKKEDSIWWRDRDKATLIRAAAEKLQDETDQPWSVTNAFKFTNRFFESQFVGRALGIQTSELPMRGCHATPFQGHLLRAAKRETTFAPSYHFVTDLAAQEAWTNLPGGPSESWFSRWYKSDIPRWLAGEYKRLAPESSVE
ncbi:MAG TPA: penicillin acylase family protein [Pirellulales bacterium]|nr:penicillin acylase family protein [Pirellulales bacterium]